MELTELRAKLETLADELEALARTNTARNLKKSMEPASHRIPTDLFAIAWDIKQIARWHTSSFGV